MSALVKSRHLRRKKPCPLYPRKGTCAVQLGMSALCGGLNRSTQHSISFYLLGFEPQSLARTASDAKVPGFSAAVKPRKNSRRFVTHSVFPLQDRECCVDRLNRPPIADITAEHQGPGFAALKMYPLLLKKYSPASFNTRNSFVHSSTSSSGTSFLRKTKSRMKVVMPLL